MRLSLNSYERDTLYLQVMDFVATVSTPITQGADWGFSVIQARISPLMHCGIWNSHETLAQLTTMYGKN